MESLDLKVGTWGARIFGPTTSSARLVDISQEASIVTGPRRTPPPPERPPVGFDGHVLVAGYLVAALQQGESISPLPRPPGNSPTTLTACPWIKLRVAGTLPPSGSPPIPRNLGGPVWIDSDRQIVLPSSQAAVGVMLPPDWTINPPNDLTIDGPAMTVFLQIRICDWHCSWPTALPILTERFLDAADPISTNRPRAARTLHINGQAAAQTWPINAGSQSFGTLLVGAGAPGVFDPLPAFDTLVSPGVAGVERVLAWGVQP